MPTTTTLTGLIHLCVLASLTGGCEGSAGGGDTKDATAKTAAADAAEEAAAEEKAAKEKERRVAERKAEEQQREKAYQDAKPGLEAFAKLPRKHPKGFGAACDAMFEQYDAYMHKSLEGDDLAKWEEKKEDRIRVMRRACHNRSVEAVVCETQILKKAPAGADVDHIMRVCQERFGAGG